MRKIIILLLISVNLFSQSECYTSNKYLYLDNPLENLREVKNEIGICFNSAYFSIFLNGKTTVLPIMYESIQRQKNSNGELQYTFMNDKTDLNSIGDYNIIITYSKERLITIDNAGRFYIIKYKTDKYLIISEKKIKNVDSLALENKKKDSLYKIKNTPNPKIVEYLKEIHKDDSIQRIVDKLNMELRDKQRRERELNKKNKKNL